MCCLSFQTAWRLRAGQRLAAFPCHKRRIDLLWPRNLLSVPRFNIILKSSILESYHRTDKQTNSDESSTNGPQIFASVIDNHKYKRTYSVPIMFIKRMFHSKSLFQMCNFFFFRYATNINSFHLSTGWYQQNSTLRSCQQLLLSSSDIPCICEGTFSSQALIPESRLLKG